MAGPHFFIIHDAGSRGFGRQSRPKKISDLIQDRQKRVAAILDMTNPGSFKWNARKFCDEILAADGVLPAERQWVENALARLG